MTDDSEIGTESSDNSTSLEDAVLNARQQLFVKEYLIDLNASSAARRAGYSADTAGSIGHALLKNIEIDRQIQEALDARSKRVQITADMVLAELGRIGFSNMNNYADWSESNVSLIPSNELDEDALRCVSEISQSVTTAGSSVKFKLHDKVAALEKIARHLGMFNDKLQLGGDPGNPLITAIKIELVPGVKE